MTNKQQNEYSTDKVSPPGETLAEMLETLGMARAELPVRLGCLCQAVAAIIGGEAPITAEWRWDWNVCLAQRRVFGASAMDCTRRGGREA